MDVDDQVAIAISQFTAWERPWQFSDSVLQSPGLSPEGRAAFELVWRLAKDDPAWRGCVDLAEACQAVDLSLQAAVPSLAAAARGYVVRAAFYEWR